MRSYCLLALVSVLILACSKDENFATDLQPGLQGTWLLTERGWSPGSGYFVDPVSPTPAQTITFTGHKGFSSNLEGLAHFKFYVIKTDTSDVSRLHLYVDDPELIEHNTPAFNTFMIELSDNYLKIMQQCFEGCHLGFRKNGLVNQ
jgi:hypothetical protein